MVVITLSNALSPSSARPLAGIRRAWQDAQSTACSKAVRMVSSRSAETSEHRARTNQGVHMSDEQRRWAWKGMGLVYGQSSSFVIYHE
jgi:hypothetical protein